MQMETWPTFVFEGAENLEESCFISEINILTLFLFFDAFTFYVLSCFEKLFQSKDALLRYLLNILNELFRMYQFYKLFF